MTDRAWCSGCGRVVDSAWCDRCRRPLEGGPSRLELADAGATPDTMRGTVVTLHGFVRLSGTFNRDVYFTLEDVADGSAVQIGDQVEFVLDNSDPRGSRARKIRRTVKS